jgi:hypothetical protein
MRHVGAQVSQIGAALTSSEALEKERIRLVSNELQDLAERVETVYTTTREQFELRINGVQRELAIANNAAATAIAKAEAATEKRFASVNEFRAQLADQVARFVPREVADGQFSQARAEREAMADRITRMEVSQVNFVQQGPLATRLNAIETRAEQIREQALLRETFQEVVAGWTIWRESVDQVITRRAGERAAMAQTEARIQPWALWGAGAVVTVLVACIVIVTNILTS